MVVLVGVLGGFALGVGLANEFSYPFSPGFNDPGPPWLYLGSNLRALALAVILGSLSFGSMAVATLLGTSAVVTYLATQVAREVSVVERLAPAGDTDLPTAPASGAPSAGGGSEVPDVPAPAGGGEGSTTQ